MRLKLFVAWVVVGAFVAAAAFGGLGCSEVAGGPAETQTAAVASALSATAWGERKKLLAGDGAPTDIFGWSVSLSGDTALVGAHGDDDNGSFPGSAYVFVRSGGVWSQQQKLLPADGAAGDTFGYSVALSEDTALVGARGDGDNGVNSDRKSVV